MKEINMEEVKQSFERTDRIIAFKKELTRLINRHGIDSLLGVPDYILATAATAQMEICGSIAGGVNGYAYKPVLMM